MNRFNSQQYIDLNPGMYATEFNRTVMILDVKNDKYLVLDEKVSSFFLTFLFQEINLENAYTSSSCEHRFQQMMTTSDLEIPASLKEENIIQLNSQKPTGLNFHVNNKTGGGLEDFIWTLPDKNLYKAVGRSLIIEAYLALLKIDLILKLYNLSGLLAYLQKMSKQQQTKILPEKVEPFAIALDQASFYYFKRVKCLQWAAALASMCYKRKWNAEFSIGVQLYPFHAHAWVEVNHLVINDDPKLPFQLSKIFSSYFK